MKLTTEYLKECFEYSEESPSGLVWKERPQEHFTTPSSCVNTNNRWKGKIAGSKNKRNDGRSSWYVKICGIMYCVHRVVYSLHYADLNESYQIDHIDCNPLNNSIKNLRIATGQENQRNRPIQKNNKVGSKGVSINKRNPYKKYRAVIYINKRQINLGCFYTEFEASEAYMLACELHFGEFGRLA